MGGTIGNDIAALSYIKWLGVKPQFDSVALVIQKKREKQKMEDLKNIEEVERVEEKEIVVISEEQKESFMKMLMKTKQIYDTVLQDYFSQPAVVRLIYMENRFRPLTAKLKSLEELKDFMEKELEMMRSKINMTNIEKIEYRLAKRIYRDVVEGKGNEYDIRKPLSYDYDGQKMQFADIKMAEKELFDDFEAFLKDQEEIKKRKEQETKE